MVRVDIIKDFSKQNWENNKFLLVNTTLVNSSDLFESELLTNGDVLWVPPLVDHTSESDNDLDIDYEYGPFIPHRLFYKWEEHVFHNITSVSTVKRKLTELLPLPYDVISHIITFLNGSKTLHFVPYIYSNKYNERMKNITEGLAAYEYIHSLILVFTESLGERLVQREHPMETIQKVLDAHITKKTWPTLQESFVDFEG